MLISDITNCTHVTLLKCNTSCCFGFFFGKKNVNLALCYEITITTVIKYSHQNQPFKNPPVYNKRANNQITERILMTEDKRQHGILSWSDRVKIGFCLLL